MIAIAATSFNTERLDLLYLDQYFRMVHWGFNPLPSSVDQSSPLMTSIIRQSLGGMFSTPPVAVSVSGTTPLLSGPPTKAKSGLQAHEASSVGKSLQVPPGVHNPVPGGGVLPGGPGGPLPIGNRPIAPSEFFVELFALHQNHSMRVLRMPNGLAAVHYGPGDEQEADFIDLGGNFISAPAVVAYPGPRVLRGIPPAEVIEVFGIQADRAMYRCTTNRTPLGDYYGTWASLGGIFTSAPSAVAGGLGKVDVFARDANFQLAHSSWNGKTWSDWENLGGSLASAPVAVSWGPNRIDVFALSTDGSVGHTWWDGQIWNQWQPLVPPAPSISLVGTPSAITWGPERLDVFVSGNDSNLYHYTQTAGAFGAPELLGAKVTEPPDYADPFTPSPTAIAVATNHMVAFGLTNSAPTPAATYRIWDGAAWRGWASLDSCALPSRYRFSVDYVTCKTPRALIEDSDTAIASITAGNGSIQHVSQNLLNLSGTQQAQTNLLILEPVPVELCETVIFSYQVLNSAASETEDINTALRNVAIALAQYALKEIEGDLGSLKAITSIPVATSVVPVIGTILTLLGEWLIKQLPGAIIPGTCDGMVALEQAVLLGTDIVKGRTVTTDHPGTTSPQGCGATSQYQVLWSITPV